MRRVRWATCLWPGLTQLWHEGSLVGLALAITFTLLFNLALLVTWAWVEAVSPSFRLVLWSTVTIWWSAAAIASYYWTTKHPPQQDENQSGTDYQRAAREYLRRNWLQAETILEQLLKQNPHDIDAQLMLASLFRHTRRFDEAGTALNRIRRLDGWRKWELEVHREQRQLSQLHSNTSKQIDPSSDSNHQDHSADWTQAA